MIRLALHGVEQRKRTVLWIGFGATLIIVMTMSMYRSIGDDYAALTDAFPDAIASLIGGADFGTPAGYLQAELFAIAGVEQDGELELIATLPLSRRTIAASAQLATAIGVVAVCAISGVTAAIAFGG
ncbi:MAG: hypothetical protein ACI8Y4_004534 [Candidatus Poriferisodalaceae bacterium]|jgi:hypothetical protein